jgi:hypothetical protein
MAKDNFLDGFNKDRPPITRGQRVVNSKTGEKGTFAASIGPKAAVYADSNPKDFVYWKWEDFGPVRKMAKDDAQSPEQEWEHSSSVRNGWLLELARQDLKFQ